MPKSKLRLITSERYKAVRDHTVYAIRSIDIIECHFKVGIWEYNDSPWLISMNEWPIGTYNLQYHQWNYLTQRFNAHGDPGLNRLIDEAIKAINDVTVPLSDRMIKLAPKKRRLTQE